MKLEIVQGLLHKVASDMFNDDELADNGIFFQTMAKFKYDGYKQFAPGMRFLERFALWLQQFDDINDRKIAFNFVKNKLIYISGPEMDLLVSSSYPDVVKPILGRSVAEKLGIPDYKINKIYDNTHYKSLLRQSLFCGLSDGARTEIFRRANNNVLSHEQIYQTYELSDRRATKMKEELISDQTNILGREPSDEESKFKFLFLLDDFSASGTSYLKYNASTNSLKGKINALYDNIYNRNNLSDVFDLDNLEVHIILYLCTEQAKESIEANFELLTNNFSLTKNPSLHVSCLISDSYRITDENIKNLCNKDTYYDASALEDRHTGTVKMGYSDCALPIVLYHNCPNNSVSILWAYENALFQGLFPRVPRHKEI